MGGLLDGYGTSVAGGGGLNGHVPSPAPNGQPTKVALLSNGNSIMHSTPIGRLQQRISFLIDRLLSHAHFL